MAVLAGALANTRAAKDPSGGDDSAPALGVAASLTLAQNVSQNLALPTDANTRLYPAYLITADANTWFNFCTTSGDAAVAAAANTYLVNGSGLPVLVATPQAQLNGQVGAFLAAITQVAAGSHINIVGVF
jgi:hypothetical protein